MAQQDSGLYRGIFALKYKNVRLRLALILFGLLAILIGLYPFLRDWGFLPALLQFLPPDGDGYRMIVLLLGLLMLVIGVRTKSK